MPDEHGRLTPHDLAFGLGRKATKEELEELINRPQGPGVDIETARRLSKDKLQAAREKREAKGLNPSHQ